METENAEPTAIVNTKDMVQGALQRYARELTKLPDADLPDATRFLAKLEKMAKEVKQTLNRRIQKRVRESGTEVSEAGSMTAYVEGQIWKIVPTGTTDADMDKVCALLAARGETDLNRFFTKKTKVICTRQDLDILVNTLSLLSREEADACLPERGYRVEIKELDEE